MYCKMVKILHVIGIALLVVSCSTAMSPTKLNATLPKMTKSRFYSRLDARDAVAAKECSCLVKGREYVAPIGTTTSSDLRNGAKGIDEWVQLDGGNAYALNSFRWVTVDHFGSTQLQLEFDTMLCQ